MNNAEKYTYRVFWSEEDQAHIGVCSEFKGLSWVAETGPTAYDGIVKQVAEAIQILEEDGDEVPPPFSERKYSGVFQVRVTPDRHRELAVKAGELGVSMNRLISDKLAG